MPPFGVAFLADLQSRRFAIVFYSALAARGPAGRKRCRSPRRTSCSASWACEEPSPTHQEWPRSDASITRRKPARRIETAEIPIGIVDDTERPIGDRCRHGEQRQRDSAGPGPVEVNSRHGEMRRKAEQQDAQPRYDFRMAAADPQA